MKELAIKFEITCDRCGVLIDTKNRPVASVTVTNVLSDPKRKEYDLCDDCSELVVKSVEELIKK